MKKNIGFITLSAIAIAVTLLTSGCGRDKADAMKNYKDIPTTPQKQVQAEATKIGDVFKITCITCETDNKSLVFYESERAQIKFKVESLLPQITKATLFIDPSSEALGASLTPSTRAEEQGIWYFNWQPGKMLSGPMDKKIINVVVVAQSIEVARPLTGSYRNTFSFGISIVPSQVRPYIESDTVPAHIEQGKKASFTISIVDPAIQGGQSAPALNILPYTGAQNAENPKYDGTSYIRKTGVSEHQGNGKYTYSLEIDTSLGRLPKENDSSSDGINLCVNIGLVSTVNRNPSVESRPYCVRVLFTVRAPQIKWLSGAKEGSRIQEITAGVPNTIKFEAFAPGDNGVITVSTNANKNWPSEASGAPIMECDPAVGMPAPKRVCTVTWTPSCKSAISERPLQLLRVSMTNTSGAVTKRTNDDVMALVVNKKDEAACAPKAKEAKASEAKPAVAPKAKEGEKPEVKANKKEATKAKGNTVKKVTKVKPAAQNAGAPVAGAPPTASGPNLADTISNDRGDR